MAEVSRLPGPVLERWEWQYRGACRGTEPSAFFHPEGERGPSRRRRAAAAKAVCATCPVLQPCRDHALAAREPYGVWGGMTEEERAAAISGRLTRAHAETSRTLAGTSEGDVRRAS